MGKYRFIAIDVDGTLLDDNDKFDVNRLNQDIELLQRQNYHFIIASGNSYDALSTIFQPCPLVKEFVAENGGRLIVNGKSVYGIQLRHCNSFMLLLSIRSLALTSYLYLAKRKQSLPSSIEMFQSFFILTTHIFLTCKKLLSQFIT